MRACIQRVSQASVTIGGEVHGAISHGLVVLLGVAADDTARDAQFLAEKVVGLRVFEDNDGKMNRALAEAGASALVVSQFTLLGDCRKGRRPSFVAAAPPELAEELYMRFVELLREQDVHVETGQFRQHMEVALVNDGPVTLLLDSHRLF